MHISYVDDADFFAVDPDPRRIAAKASAVVGVVCRPFEAHVFTVNRALGKTEVAFAWRGPRSRQARLEMELVGGLEPLDAPAGPLTNIVGVYKHMGAMAPPSRSIKPEVANRATSARLAFASLGPRLLPAGPITSATKVMLVRSLVESRLFFNSAVWVAFAVDDLRPLDAVRVVAWRRLKGRCSFRAGQHVPDAALWHDMQECTAEQVLRIHRLRYLARVIKAAPPLLAAVVQAVEAADSWRCLSWPILRLGFLRRAARRLLAALVRGPPQGCPGAAQAPARRRGWLEAGTPLLGGLPG